MPYSAALSTNISTNFWPAALQGGEETDLAFLGLLVATSSWLVQTPQCLLFPLFLSRFATNLLMLMMPSQCFYPGIISGSLLLPRDRQGLWRKTTHGTWDEKQISTDSRFISFCFFLLFFAVRNTACKLELLNLASIWLRVALICFNNELMQFYVSKPRQA